jgi:hypothetical protein
MLKAGESGLIAAQELALARRDLTEEQYAQEFECSFEAAVVGADYGRQMADAERAGRIAAVPYEPAATVWTAWDLRIRDATAIWFAQVVGREIRRAPPPTRAGGRCSRPPRTTTGPPTRRMPSASSR